MKEVIGLIFIVGLIGYIVLIGLTTLLDNQEKPIITNNGMIIDFKLPDGTRCIGWDNRNDGRISGLSCDFFRRGE